VDLSSEGNVLEGRDFVDLIQCLSSKSNVLEGRHLWAQSLHLEAKGVQSEGTQGQAVLCTWTPGLNPPEGRHTQAYS
jgi:hypothetical protein